MYSAFKARKLVVPALPHRHVARPRLTDLLDTATQLPVTVVAAGPASGKTVLLSEWVRSREVRAAWVSLDPADNAEAPFWRLVDDALAPVGVGDPATELDPRRSVADDTLERVASQVSLAEPLFLILDDAHVLNDPLLLSQLDALLRFPVAGLHVVLAARSDPLLPLHRYRVAGQLSELRAVDLAMTTAEVDDLLEQHGVHLDADSRDLLTARTEGWVAGLHLSMVRMEGSAEPERFVNAFALDRGSAGEYLLEEVLAARDAKARRLLIRTSTCELVNGSLADAICGEHGSAAVLERLARSNSFVTAVPGAEGWFRYHLLMREVLTHLLASESPASRQAVDAAAARWHAAEGNVIEALHHALRARDWEHVADLLSRDGFIQLFLSDGRRVVDVLTPFVQSEIPENASYSTRVAVASAQAAVAVTMGDHVGARRALAALAENPTCSSLAPDPLGPQDADRYSLLADYARLGVAARTGDAAAVEVVGRRLLDSDPKGPFSVFALTRLGGADLWLGRLESAEDRLQTASQRARDLGMTPFVVETTGLLAIQCCSWGRMGRAQEHVRDGAVALRSSSRVPSGQRVTHHVAAAEVAMAAGDLEEFEVQMAVVESLLGPEVEPAVVATRSLMRAKALHTAGRYDEAARTLTSEAALRSPGAYNLVAIGRAMLADAATMSGRPHDRPDIEVAAAEPNAYVSNVVGLARARAQLAEGDLLEAERFVRRVVTASAPAASLPLLVEAVLVGVEVALAAGDERRAVEQAAYAIDLGSGGGVLLPFVDATPRLRPLLARHSSLADRWPVPLYGPTDVSAPMVNEGQCPELNPVQPMESLTDRELSVLRWLTTMMSVSEIADELCVSTNTVKTHVSAIYRKLGVAKRREAVARGRELHLI